MTTRVLVQVKGGQARVLSGTETILSLDDQLQLNIGALTSDATELAERFGLHWLDLAEPEWSRWDGLVAIENGTPVLVYTRLSLPAITADISARIQHELDKLAMQRGYDSLASAISYATSTVPAFKADAEYLVQLRDDVWSQANTLLAQYKAGELPEPPGMNDVLALLPPIAFV